jgi:hypothetical protein
MQIGADWRLDYYIDKDHLDLTQAIAYTASTHSYPETVLSTLKMGISPPKCQIINAPSREPPRGVKSIFLAGSTEKTDDSRDWREVLSELLADQDLTIYNSLQPDWNSSWREDISFKPYR